MFVDTTIRTVSLPGDPVCEKASSVGASNAPVQALPDGDAAWVPLTSGVAVVVLRTATPSMCRPGWPVVTPPALTTGSTEEPTSGSGIEGSVHEPATGTANS